MTKAQAATKRREGPAITEATKLSPRERRLRAIEHATFAEELEWLAMRAYQSLRYGPDSDHRLLPLPKYPLLKEGTLASFGRWVVDARLPVEKRADLRTKYPKGLYELFALLESLVRLAEIHKKQSDEYSEDAGRFGRTPSIETMIETMVKRWREARGLPSKPKGKKVGGPKPKLDITTEELDLRVAKLQKENGVKTVREACRVEATNQMERDGTLPGAKWRRDQAVEKEAKRLASRLSAYRLTRKSRTPNR